MLEDLKQLEANCSPIHVGIVGLGSMGLAIAYQISITPGMRLTFLADKNIIQAQKAAEIYGKPVHVTSDCIAALNDEQIVCDVLVEATNSIVDAYDYCMAAIDRKVHCVLMNAEVDLALGFLLRAAAEKKGVVVTSDAGDQHGVLCRLIEEIEMWGFGIVQAGNMKGFLDRYRTLGGSIEIAKSLRLSPIQCLAYTDGSKLNIEMAIIANQYGLTPQVPGMCGPRADRVEDVMDIFDFNEAENGNVDYILGAKQHGGGVYVVARCENELQRWYLDYYKVINRHPYYLFFRPYHLCHLETTRAISLAAMYGKAVCTMKEGRVTDCYAYAKRKLTPGKIVCHGIGSDELYGMINTSVSADSNGFIPQVLFESSDQTERPVIKKVIDIDSPITWDAVEIPKTRLLDLWSQQMTMLNSAQLLAKL
jgi:predicted homoserine dehydrogenase-like protein